MLLCPIKVYLKLFQHQVVSRRRMRATECVAVKKKGMKRARKGAMCDQNVSFLGGSSWWRGGLAQSVQGGSVPGAQSCCQDQPRAHVTKVAVGGREQDRAACQYPDRRQSLFWMQGGNRQRDPTLEPKPGSAISVTLFGSLTPCRTCFLLRLGIIVRRRSRTIKP